MAVLLAASILPMAARADGWELRGFGGFRGDLELRIGAKFWRDQGELRNLQLRGSAQITPWLRANAIARRREGSWRDMPLHPDIDEAYLQSSAFYVADRWNLSLDGKVGRVRYRHFPYPDAIAAFDQVPGISDLTGGPQTDYRGMITSAELDQSSGFGAHFTHVAWGFGGRTGASVVETYGFFRRDIGGGWRTEFRAGGLANRPEPLGRNAIPGIDLYLGKQLGPFTVGFLYEKRENEQAYTGVMVTFGSTPITRAAGTLTLDYQRHDEGASVEATLARVTFGQARDPGPDAILVGEIYATRLRTLWQGGYNRNYAELRTSSEGETNDPSLLMVAEEAPWYLDLESLVSPHTTVSNSWFRDRKGPGEFRQDVVYRFYRKSPKQ